MPNKHIKEKYTKDALNINQFPPRFWLDVALIKIMSIN